MKTVWTFLVAIAVLFILCLLTGCAQMGTVQSDDNVTTRFELDKKGATNAITHETRKTRTRAKGTAVVTGATVLEGFSAIQNGDKQGLDIKKTSQKTDGLAQAVQTLQAFRDLAGMAYGFPPSQSAAGQQMAPPAGKKWILVPDDEPPTPPAGKKWILAPKDEPSIPQPEIDPQ